VSCDDTNFCFSNENLTSFFTVYKVYEFENMVRVGTYIKKF